MHPWPLLKVIAVRRGHVMLTSGATQVSLREDESVTIQPLWVLGVKPHELVEEDVGNWCHAPVKEVLSVAMFLSLQLHYSAMRCAHLVQPSGR